MKIRSLDEVGYEVLHPLLRLLNKSLELDFITEHKLRRCTIEDPNFLPENVLLAYEGRQLVGTIIGAERIRSPSELVEKDKDKCWIKVIAIHPDYRNRRIFQSLLSSFEDLMKSKGKVRIIAGDFCQLAFLCRYRYSV